MSAKSQQLGVSRAPGQRRPFNKELIRACWLSRRNSLLVGAPAACLLPRRPRRRPDSLHRGPSEPSWGRLPTGAVPWAWVL
eukprot:2965826-Alexandrium_andersonii.AAC.1